ncbi:MAG TPA: hypothetical protein VMT92_07675 [Steroidobacteraceae bacterium]|nr:hypothetical protein [Steroidobacteraceae bacterium]
MPTPAERLKDALAALTGPSADDRAPTVTALCRRADVSRNSLYRYHPDVLEALHAYRRRRLIHSTCESGTAVRRLQSELSNTREQIPKLVALIDHYYAAYQEARTLLDRRERELAELRRRLDAKPSRVGR